MDDLLHANATTTPRRHRAIQQAGLRMARSKSMREALTEIGPQMVERAGQGRSA